MGQCSQSVLKFNSKCFSILSFPVYCVFSCVFNYGNLLFGILHHFLFSGKASLLKFMERWLILFSSRVINMNVHKHLGYRKFSSVKTAEDKIKITFFFHSQEIYLVTRWFMLVSQPLLVGFAKSLWKTSY